MEKLFWDAEKVAVDLDISKSQATKLINALAGRIRNKGGIAVPGVIQRTYYLQMKESGFLSDDGAEKEDRPLTEKRLLCLEEFCIYSGLGQHTVRSLAADLGIKKQIGRRVLYDRVLFDQWCNSCAVWPGGEKIAKEG